MWPLCTCGFFVCLPVSSLHPTFILVFGYLRQWVVFLLFPPPTFLWRHHVGFLSQGFYIYTLSCSWWILTHLAPFQHVTLGAHAGSLERAFLSFLRNPVPRLCQVLERVICWGFFLAAAVWDHHTYISPSLLYQHGSFRSRHFLVLFITVLQWHTKYLANLSHL